ncbi:MAG: WbuC family cupin fold metalloprotein [Rhodospirillales bacterium]
MITAREWEAKRFRENTPGVLSATEGVTTVDADIITGLKDYARSMPQQRARILMHHGHDALIHEMLIAAIEYTLWPPLFNNWGSQSWHVLEGEIAFVEYAPEGDIIEIRIISALRSGLPTYLRLASEAWYTIVPLTGMSVYLETRQGPFQDLPRADWGPQGSLTDPRSAGLRARLKELGYATDDTRAYPIMSRT